MADFVEFLENDVLNRYFGKDEGFTVPTTLHVGLSTTTISNDGSNITEPTDGYNRVSVDNDKVTWTTSTSGALSNDIEITFPEATGDWGTVTDFFISDAATGGNIFVAKPLNVSKTISEGDIAKFQVNELTISLD